MDFRGRSELITKKRVDEIFRKEMSVDMLLEIVRNEKIDIDIMQCELILTGLEGFSVIDQSTIRSALLSRSNIRLSEELINLVINSNDFNSQWALVKNRKISIKDEQLDYIIMGYGDGERFVSVVSEAIERVQKFTQKQINRSVRDDRLIAATWLKRNDFRTSKRNMEYLIRHDDLYVRALASQALTRIESKKLKNMHFSKVMVKKTLRVL